MEIIETGHIYAPKLRTAKGNPKPDVPAARIVFVNKQPGQEHEGTTTQEVLRVLLDRTRHCNNCMPHPNNERIIYHLRMALILHEARALERKVEKGEILPEYMDVGEDGHFVIGASSGSLPNHTTKLEPYRQDWDRECKHPLARATNHQESGEKE